MEGAGEAFGKRLRACIRVRIGFGRKLRVYVKNRIGFGRRSITLDVMLRMLSGCRRGIA